MAGVWPATTCGPADCNSGGGSGMRPRHPPMSGSAAGSDASLRRLSSTNHTHMRRLSRGLPRVGRGFFSCASARVKVVMVSVYLNVRALPSESLLLFLRSVERDGVLLHG